MTNLKTDEKDHFTFRNNFPLSKNSWADLELVSVNIFSLCLGFSF